MSPNPPRITAEIVGMEERVHLEELVHQLASRRDRLCREINILRGLVVIKHLSDRDEEIARLSKAVTKIDVKMSDALKEMKKYTGSVKAILRWSFPGHVGEAVLSGYQIYVNQRQYGRDLTVHTINALIELPCDMRPHVVTVVTTTNHPVGSSPDSNVIKISTEEFFPFSFFCYFDIHVKGARYPDVGCCNNEETLQVETNRKHNKPGKPIPYRGTLSKKIPPPCAEGLEIRSGEWKPVVEKKGKPTFVLFWTKWCRASIQLMKYLTRYAEDNPQNFAFVSCCTHSGESSKTHLHKLQEMFDYHGRSSLASVQHLCTCQQNMDSQLIRCRISVNTFALSSTAELHGVVGVPSVVIVNSEGYVSWQGRLCALSYQSFSLSVRHLLSEVSRLPCDVHDCAMCTAESHQDFNHVEHQQEKSNASSSTVKRNFFPGLSSSAKSKRDIKKKLRTNPQTSSSTGYSPRILPYKKISRHQHTKSASPRFDNSYEEEFIQEILTPRLKRNNSKFLNIHDAPTPTKTRTIRISAGPRRRETISTPTVENSNVRKVYANT